MGCLFFSVFFAYSGLDLLLTVVPIGRHSSQEKNPKQEKYPYLYFTLFFVEGQNKRESIYRTANLNFSTSDEKKYHTLSSKYIGLNNNLSLEQIKKGDGLEFYIRESVLKKHNLNEKDISDKLMAGGCQTTVIYQMNADAHRALTVEISSRLFEFEKNIRKCQQLPPPEFNSSQVFNIFCDQKYEGNENFSLLGSQVNGKNIVSFRERGWPFRLKVIDDDVDVSVLLRSLKNIKDPVENPVFGMVGWDVNEKDDADQDATDRENLLAHDSGFLISFLNRIRNCSCFCKCPHA
jgi:hypothetical protein